MIVSELTKEDMHNFKIIKTKESDIINDKKVTKNTKKAIFKNIKDTFPNVHHIYKLDQDNVSNIPESLKDVEIFDAVFPFYKKPGENCYYKYGFDMSTILLAFKNELIDGFYIKAGGLFKAFWEKTYTGFIVIDPNKRKAVRDFFNKNYEEILKKYIIDDNYKYGIGKKTAFIDFGRIGKIKDQTYEKALNEIIEDHKNKDKDGKPHYNRESEQLAVKMHGEDKIDSAIATMMCYKVDYRANGLDSSIEPIKFDSLEEANDFCNDYNAKTNYYNEIVENSKDCFYPMIINDELDKYYYEQRIKNYKPLMCGCGE